MENYQKMYSTLFNAITDALAQIENQNYGDAKDILISTSQQRIDEAPSQRGERQQCRPRRRVCRQANVTRASRSKARLRPVTNCRRFMAKPCTPHLITRKGYATSVRQQSCQRLCNPQVEQFFKIEPANVWGRGGGPLFPFFGGVEGGLFSFRGKRTAPL